MSKIALIGASGNAGSRILKELEALLSDGRRGQRKWPEG